MLAALILAPVPLGTYFVGTGSGDNNTLILKEGGKYEYKFDGCFGGSESDGTFSVQGDDLVLAPQPKQRGELKLSPRLAIVPWGERTFLIPPASLPTFCAAYRNGWRGRDKTYDGYFMRDNVNRASETPELARAGQPLVPSKWRAQLKTPLQGKVLKVKGAECSINLGQEDGIAPGTVFATDHRFLYVRQATTHEATCGWATLEVDKATNLKPNTPIEIAPPSLSYMARLLEQAKVIGHPDLLPKPKG